MLGRHRSRLGLAALAGLACVAAAGLVPVSVQADAQPASAAPVVHGVSPQAGPIGGQNQLAIEGSDMSSVSTVYFGSTPSTKITHVDDGRLLVVVPKHSAGQVDVRVSSGQRSSAIVKADRYDYVDQLPRVQWKKTKTKAKDGFEQAVSCASNTFCVATGFGNHVRIFNGKTWSAPRKVAIWPGHVSCGSRSFCVAMNSAKQTAVVFNGHSWSKAVALGLSRTAGYGLLSCVGNSTCFAMADGEVVRYHKGAWTQPRTVDTTSPLAGLDCPTTTFCLAIDSDGYALTFDGATWSAPEPTPYIELAQTGGPFAGVACSSPDYCVMGRADDGAGPFVLRHGVWGVAAAPYTAEGFSAADCTSARLCVLMSYREMDSHTVFVFEGARAARTGLPSDQYAHGSVSCPSATRCVAGDNTGFYVGTINPSH